MAPHQPRPRVEVAGAGGRRPPSAERRDHLRGRARRARARHGDGMVDPRPAACRPGGDQHSAHGLRPRDVVHEPASGRGRLARNPGPHPRGDQDQRRRRAAGPRHSHAHGRPCDLHRVPPGGARRHVGAGGPRYLRPSGNAIEAEIEGAQVVIHVEPEHKAKDKGAVEV